MTATKTLGLAVLAFGLVLATFDLVPAPLAVVVFLAGGLIVGAVALYAWATSRSHDAAPTVADVLPDIARGAS